MEHPYKSLKPSAFWKTGVSISNPLEMTGLWTSKFDIRKDDFVATAGSCFAQHISRAMIERGFNWLDSEPLPDNLPKTFGRSFGYGVFSFRTGNIYTTALLRQWVEAAFGLRDLDDEVWQKGGRFFDPLRPAIEPNGFASEEECLKLRAYTLKAIRKTLEKATLFVFTLGLTESWRNRRTGLTYAACPGTIAGTFDADEHEFHNLKYPEIHEDLNAVLDVIRTHNPNIRFLLTVSPVPLIATASEAHVLPATIYSKSVLRAVAGDTAQENADVDYFPSFEIISAFPYRGFFYEPNMREVANAGVDHVMTHFFEGIGSEEAAAPSVAATQSTSAKSEKETSDNFSIECEEVLLEAFAK